MFNLFKKSEKILDETQERVEFKNEIKRIFLISEEVAISITNHLTIYAKELENTHRESFKIYEKLGFKLQNDEISIHKKAPLDVSEASRIAFTNKHFYEFLGDMEKSLSPVKSSLPSKYHHILHKIVGKLIFQFYEQYDNVNDQICDIIIMKSIDQNEFHLLELFIETNKTHGIIRHFHHRAEKIRLSHKIQDTIENLRKKLDSDLENL